MDRSFNRQVHCVPPFVRFLRFWIFFFLRLCAIQRVQSPWPALLSPVPHVQQWRGEVGDALTITGERVTISYTRQKLLSMNGAPLTSDLMCRLRELCVGRNLPRKRICRRGGVRKQRRIPVVVSHRVPVIISDDCEGEQPMLDDHERWTVNSCLTHLGPTRHVTLANLTTIPLVRSPSHLVNKQLRIASFNAQSLGPCCQNKRTAVSEFILDHHIDFMFIQETWFKQKGDEGKCADLAPAGYTAKQFPRSHRGGGLAVVFRDALTSHITFNTTFPFLHISFEVVQVTLTTPQHNLQLWCLYRTYPSAKNKLTDAVFLREFPEMLALCNSIAASTVIVGDMNFHFDNPRHTSTAKMIELLGTFDLNQSVSQPTHRNGHILDWVIHRSRDNVVKSTNVTRELCSDHYCVVCDLHVLTHYALTVYKETRNLRTMDRKAFKEDLSARVSPTLCPSADDLDTTLRDALNRHAPVSRRKIKANRVDPWYESIKDELRNAKKERRRAEKQWVMTGLTVFKQIYAAAKKRVTNIVQRAKTAYYTTQISETKSAKQLFSICGKLNGSNKVLPLPTLYPISQLPKVFCDYFTTKVCDIRAELDRLSPPVTSVTDKHEPCSPIPSVFDVFHPVSEVDLMKIILKSKPTSCPLDPIPTPLLIECLDVLLPTITHIVNQSLLSGSFPSLFKAAVVKPLLKKSSLDQNVLKNYRPVSNLSFLSKLIEKVVLNQLFDYLNTHSLLSPNQSAYRPAHSTETALLKVTNDILLALDRGDISLLTLLDLSAAFDTIDHGLLFHTLQTHYGIYGTALSWFQSYLTNRMQSVIINNTLSTPQPVSFGVPQGSVLGPVLFIMYTKPLQTLIDKHAISNQAFADDTQLHTSFTPDQVYQTTHKLQTCISQVKAWMTDHKLKLNDDKTEVLLFHTKKSFSAFPKPSSLLVGKADIPFSSSARNLGFVISDDMSLENHITHICKSAYAAIRQISFIRNCLSTAATKTLVYALVLSRLDYGNALLAGCPKRCLDKLQKVQNSAARLVLKARRRDHITPLLKSLHWLPVKSRIQYKLSLLCHKYFLDFTPDYISELLSVYTPSRPLRSSNDSRILHIPATRTKAFGERTFTFAAPTQWNSLPKDIRYIDSTPTFKQALKTHLFKQHYTSSS